MFRNRIRPLLPVLAALAGGLSCSDGVTVNSDGRQAVDLVRLSSANQSAPAGSQLADPVVVQAQDGDGNGVPGEVITWVTSSGGLASPRSSTTDAAGLASTSWTLSDSAGVNSLTAAGFGSTIEFRATGTAAPAPHLVFTVQPSDVKRGTQIRPAVKVAVFDASGRQIDGARNAITVRLGNNSLGLATLNGKTSKDANHGEAAFADLSVSGLTLFNSLTLIASSPGLAEVTSTSFNVQ